MALLYRFVRTNDKSDTEIFTFVVTRSVTRDVYRDITSKDFVYGYHKWAISFTRTDKVLGIFLVLRSASPGIKCYVDFSFTLANRDHFSKNEVYLEQRTKYTIEQPAHGNRKWILLTDLADRNFSDENGEFLVELCLNNIRTVFEDDIPIHPRNLSSSEERLPNSAKTDKTGNKLKSNKLETSYFSFGNFDWNVSLTPNADDSQLEKRTKVSLNRLTGFDHQCRVRYRLILGERDRRVDSGILDHISDINGRIRGFTLRNDLKLFVRKGLLKVHLEIISANTASEVKIYPGDGGLRHCGKVQQCYDRDKQAWTVEAEFNSEYLRLRLSYTDIFSVPRNHLRFVCWQAHMVRRNTTTGICECVPVSAFPYSAYFVQDDSDMGTVMETDIPTKEVLEQNNQYTAGKDHLNIQIEWIESQMLFQATYHKYDDLFRIHNNQMRREIGALQCENYSLERQLVSYQKSLSLAHTRGTEPEDWSACNHGATNSNEFYHRDYTEGNNSFSETE
ncbi:Uncharacterised protein g5709 [Pycnogonum litorale]